MDKPAPSQVAWVDTETTGLHRYLHQIWEVGLIMPDGAEHRWFLPVDLSRADPQSLAIGGYHDRHPHGYHGRVTPPADRTITRDHQLTPPDKFTNYFARLTQGLHLAGACVHFDDERLARLIMEHEEQPDWHYHIIDVEALAAGHLTAVARQAEAEGRLTDAAMIRQVATPPWDSRELSAAIGVNREDYEAHTAIGDCRWAKAMHEAVYAPWQPAL